MNEKQRVIPKQNYVIYGILVAVTVALTFLFCNWYNIRKDLNKENTIMSAFLVKVNENEFENYVVENSNVIIYLASSQDKDLDDFEKAFKDLLIRTDLQNQMIFIDLESIDNSFLINLKNNYLSEQISNINIGKYTNILIMESGQINSILYSKETKINITDVEEYFYNRGLIAQA